MPVRERSVDGKPGTWGKRGGWGVGVGRRPIGGLWWGGGRCYEVRRHSIAWRGWERARRIGVRCHQMRGNRHGYFAAKMVMSEPEIADEVDKTYWNFSAISPTHRRVCPYLRLQ